MITLNNKKLCENCFSEISSEPCPHCGFVKSSYRQDPVALVPGSILNQRYMIGGVIGKGGFGITYLAYDIKLDARVAVKEYYPMGLALRNPGNTLVTVSSRETEKSFRTGAEKFYNEAKMVAKFNGNPNIVSVHDFFYENDTVYFIMGYLQGQTLKSYLNNKKITEGQAVNIFDQISNALLAAHGMNILHRDISPDNIMLCDDYSIRLLDFGAARQVVAEQSQSLSVILKQGFAPLEQYQQKGKQGPWSDIYALGATIYTALTGQMLTDPMSRLEDDSEYAANKFGISENLWKVIYKCTQLKIQDRYQDIAELKEDLAHVGIETEKFSDIEEEITDCLRGNAPEGGALGSNISYAPAADPNATVFLGAEDSQDNSSNETMALSPEEAAVYAGANNAAPFQQAPVNAVPVMPVTGAGMAQPMQQPDQRMSQPMPNQGIQPGMNQRSVTGQPGMNQAMQQPQMGQPQMQQPRPPMQNQQPPVRPVNSNRAQQGQPPKKKKGIHPVLLVILIILGIFIFGIVLICLIPSGDNTEAEWAEFKESFGISIKDLDNTDKDEYSGQNMPAGVLVKAVVEGGSADKAGIRSDDIITEFDGDDVTSWVRLKEEVLKHEKGDTVNITIERKTGDEYEEKKGTITLGGENTESPITDDENKDDSKETDEVSEAKGEAATDTVDEEISEESSEDEGREEVAKEEDKDEARREYIEDNRQNLTVGYAGASESEKILFITDDKVENGVFMIIDDDTDEVTKLVGDIVENDDKTLTVTDSESGDNITFEVRRYEDDGGEEYLEITVVSNGAVAILYEAASDLVIDDILNYL